MFGCSAYTKGSRSSPHLIFLHGLFGRKEDWHEVIEELHSDFFCIAIDLPRSIENLKEIASYPHPVTLIGYSLGGRIALQLERYVSRSVLISAHLGITSQEERARKQAWELAWKEKMQTLSSLDFFRQWYDQSIFSSLKEKPELLNDLIQTRVLRSPSDSFPLFSEMSLLKQPPLKTVPDNMHLIYGEKDRQYKTMYLKMADHACEIKDAGHTCHLEKPHALAQVLREVLC